MKRKILFVAAVAFLAVPTHALSNDVETYMQLVYNGYQAYQSVQNELKMIEYQYMQTKAQLQNLQSQNFEDLSSFSDAMSYVNDRISFVRNLDTTLTNTQVKVGDHSYNLDELYKIPGGVLSEVNDTLNDDLSENEKAEIWEKFGLDSRNYKYLAGFNERMNDTSKKITALRENVISSVQKTGDELDKLKASLTDDAGKSALAQMSATNTILFNVAGSLDDLKVSLAYTGSLLSDQSAAGAYIVPDRKLSDEFYKVATNSPTDIEIKKVSLQTFKNIAVPSSLRNFYNDLEDSTKNALFIIIFSIIFTALGLQYAITKDSAALKKGVIGVNVGIIILLAAPKIVAYVIGIIG